MRKIIILYCSLVLLLVLLLACSVSKKGKGAATPQTGETWPDGSDFDDGLICDGTECWDLATGACIPQGTGGGSCCIGDWRGDPTTCDPGTFGGPITSEANCRGEGAAIGCVWVCGNQC